MEFTQYRLESGNLAKQWLSFMNEFKKCRNSLFSLDGARMRHIAEKPALLFSSLVLYIFLVYKDLFLWIKIFREVLV